MHTMKKLAYLLLLAPFVITSCQTKPAGDIAIAKTDTTALPLPYTPKDKSQWETTPISTICKPRWEL